MSLLSFLHHFEPIPLRGLKNLLCQKIPDCFQSLAWAGVVKILRNRRIHRGSDSFPKISPLPPLSPKKNQTKSADCSFWSLCPFSRPFPPKANPLGPASRGFWSAASKNIQKICSESEKGSRGPHSELFRKCLAFNRPFPTGINTMGPASPWPLNAQPQKRCIGLGKP